MSDYQRPTPESELPPETKITNIIQHIRTLCAERGAKYLNSCLNLDYNYAVGVFESKDEIGTELTLEDILGTVRLTLQKILDRKQEYERRAKLLPKARALLQEAKQLIPANTFNKEDAWKRKNLIGAEELIPADANFMIDPEDAIVLLEAVIKATTTHEEPESSLAKMVREAMEKKSKDTH